LVAIINAPFYKLKTGVQWNLLPEEDVFEEQYFTWNTIYYQYGK
jgi:transposase